MKSDDKKKEDLYTWREEKKTDRDIIQRNIMYW